MRINYSSIHASLNHLHRLRTMATPLPRAAEGCPSWLPCATIIVYPSRAKRRNIRRCRVAVRHAQKQALGLKDALFGPGKVDESKVDAQKQGLHPKSLQSPEYPQESFWSRPGCPIIEENACDVDWNSLCFEVTARDLCQGQLEGRSVDMRSARWTGNEVVAGRLQGAEPVPVWQKSVHCMGRGRGSSLVANVLNDEGALRVSGGGLGREVETQTAEASDAPLALPSVLPSSLILKAVAEATNVKCYSIRDVKAVSQPLCIALTEQDARLDSAIKGIVKDFEVAHLATWTLPDSASVPCGPVFSLAEMVNGILTLSRDLIDTVAVLEVKEQFIREKSDILRDLQDKKDKLRMAIQEHLGTEARQAEIDVRYLAEWARVIEAEAA